MTPLFRALPIALLLIAVGMAGAGASPAKLSKAADTPFTLPPTKKNNSLWEIARAVLPKGKATPNQAMFAILRKNPHAFVNGNINRLHTKSVLTIPPLEEIMAEPRDLADDWANRHRQVWRKNPAETPAIYPLTGLSAPAETQAPVVQPAPPSPSETAPPDVPSAPQPEAVVPTVPQKEQPAEMAPTPPAPTVEPSASVPEEKLTPQPEALVPPQAEPTPEPELVVPPPAETEIKETPPQPSAPPAIPEAQAKEGRWTWYGLAGIVLLPLMLGLIAAALRGKRPHNLLETIISSGPIFRGSTEPVDIAKLLPEISPVTDLVTRTGTQPPPARQTADPAEDETKLLIAQTYLELDRPAEAREILLEVQAEGKPAQRRKAEKILAELSA
jgi:FimV-like protein